MLVNTSQNTINSSFKKQTLNNKTQNNLEHKINFAGWFDSEQPARVSDKKIMQYFENFPIDCTEGSYNRHFDNSCGYPKMKDTAALRSVLKQRVLSEPQRAGVLKDYVILSSETPYATSKEIDKVYDLVPAITSLQGLKDLPKNWENGKDAFDYILKAAKKSGDAKGLVEKLSKLSSEDKEKIKQNVALNMHKLGNTVHDGAMYSLMATLAATGAWPAAGMLIVHQASKQIPVLNSNNIAERVKGQNLLDKTFELMHEGKADPLFVRLVAEKEGDAFFTVHDALEAEGLFDLREQYPENSKKRADAATVLGEAVEKACEIENQDLPYKTYPVIRTALDKSKDILKK